MSLPRPKLRATHTLIEIARNVFSRNFVAEPLSLAEQIIAHNRRSPRMTKTNAVEDNKAFAAAILALEAQIKNAEDAAFVAEHFANYHAANQFLRNSSTPNSAPALDEPLPP